MIVLSALNGGKASDWSRPFLTNGRAVNYQRVRTSQALDTLTEYTCLSISPAFPRVRGKPDHVSSQGKEVIFAMHDIYS